MTRRTIGARPPRHPAGRDWTRWLPVVAALALPAPAAARAQAPGPPSDAPATVTRAGDRVILTYDGATLFDGTLDSAARAAQFRSLVDTSGGAVTQVLKWTATGPAPLRLTGVVRASAEGFPCEIEPRPEAPRIVRNAVGLADNLLDRAVYDRGEDWALSVDFPARATVTPLADSARGTRFRIEASGGEIALRFQPRYYQRHRGLAEFRPWTYRVWPGSVAGWSSWFAFFDRVTEADIRRTADVMATALLPWGYRYLQLDDGYERQPVGPPDDWLHPNAKFPSGLAALSRDIAERGLVPGIWTNVSFQDSAFAWAHPQYFLPAPEGGPAWGNWVGYVMDGANPATLRDLVLPVYDTLAREGWRYFKLDALRHLRYEGYNSYADVFRKRGQDRAAVYRGVVAAIRRAVGPGAYLLGCWGIRPELIGLLDGVRVGTDGFGYGGFAEYNSFNNVVWRNDPDHIRLTAPDAYRAVTLASLTGSVLMLTDPPEVYRTSRVELARRAAPVLFTVPEQLYDVDPARSSRIAEAGAALSGSGPRPFDADQRLEAWLYQLDIARPFGRWTVLARAGGPAAPIRFADLGLAPDSTYLVFEFWTRHFLGAFRRAFAPGPVDPRYRVQDFCIRARQPHPQLVATSRHVTCGGVDLGYVGWNADTLRGTSEVVGGDPYTLYVTEPAGFRFAGAAASGATVLGTARRGALRVVRLAAARSGRVAWRIAWKADR